MKHVINETSERPASERPLGIQRGDSSRDAICNDERKGAVYGGGADGGGAGGAGNSRSGYLQFLTGGLNGTVHQQQMDQVLREFLYCRSYSVVRKWQPRYDLHYWCHS